MSMNKRIGLCSWSLKPASAQELAAGLSRLGIPNVQLSLMPLLKDLSAWADVRPLLEQAGVKLASGMYGTVGENYSTLETIRLTGGIVPDATWPANWDIVQRVAPLAETLGMKMVSSHAGFLPEDQSHPTFKTIIDRLRRIADLFADHGLTLLLESGQETATTLIRFLDHLDRDNVKANFDPANMILYGKGDPIEALRLLLPRIGQVHVKDAIKTKTPGTWGKEVAAGDGEVDWPAFVSTLEGGGYKGCYVIEREAGGERAKDVLHAAELISGLLAGR
ncbi:MAG: sugar phosphate isomerase/epimerase [Phycisphaeraceae bacterium]|nr:sugar phosphate isomerase/epimerase [Phycisphaeraceae bacterium]